MSTQTTSNSGNRSGSHRSKKTSSGSRWLLVAIGLVIVALVGVGAYLLFAQDDQSGKNAMAQGQTPTPTLASPTSSLADSPTADQDTPVPSVNTAAGDLHAVEPGSPRALTFAGRTRGFDEAITDQSDHLIPNSLSELSRWDARGKPGQPTSDSVVIAGKTTVNGAFSDLSELKVGDEITIRTDNGELTYSVTKVGTIGVAGEVDNPALKNSPGRLLLVGTQYDSVSNRTSSDILVTAQLSRSVAN